MKKSLILLAIISTFLPSSKIVETIDGEFKYPTGVTADNQGNIYIADTQNNKIKIWILVLKITNTRGCRCTLYPQQMVTDFSTGFNHLFCRH